MLYNVGEIDPDRKKGVERQQSVPSLKMENILSRATPAMQVAAVVISYLVEIIQRIGSLFSFTTGITSFE